MNFKSIIQDYFTFSRNERKGATILLVIIFMLAVANKIIYYFETPAIIDAHLLDSSPGDPDLIKGTEINLAQNKLFNFNPNTINPKALDSLSLPKGVKRNMLKFRAKGGKYYAVTDFKKIYGVTDSIYKQIAPFLLFENKKVQFIQPPKIIIPVELFIFDPNTSSDQDFLRLGISEKQIQTIRNYQSKGGNFRSKADFLKIYGISQTQKEALSAYVIIEKIDKLSQEKKAEISEIDIEINGSDSIELMKLPGIGNKLSKRIVKYRDLLGGFYTLAQLKEVYGLSKQTIQQIEGMVTVDPAKVRKVDLNFADWKELAKHPYIQKNMANQIIKFRTKYGSIKEPSVLRDSLILNLEEYNRLRPYL